MLAPSVASTGSDGIAGGVRWRLGALTSTQTVRATIGAFAVAVVAHARSDFTIEVRFPGSEPSPEFQAAFRHAADRIRTAVVGDLPDVTVQSLNVSSCGGGAGGTLSETIDDIIIFASVAPIDGIGKVLARAGPCFVRNTTLQSLVGTMQFDDADALTLLNTGRFEAVVLHEMLHIVGIGSLWRFKNLVDSLGTTEPRYIGAIGVARCALIGFGTQCAPGVPVENTGGSGTAGVHWRESTFDRELMTGFTESTPDMPFSVLSVGSLADHGYEVNEKAADRFEFAAIRVGAGAAPRAAVTPEVEWEEVIFPTFEVTPFGFVHPLRPRPSAGSLRK
ncbi:MAG: leishmanolysin-related zinc metalloendopeptidase [Gemmatimonadota bacterium]